MKRTLFGSFHRRDSQSLAGPLDRNRSLSNRSGGQPQCIVNCKICRFHSAKYKHEWRGNYGRAYLSSCCFNRKHISFGCCYSCCQIALFLVRYPQPFLRVECFRALKQSRLVCRAQILLGILTGHRWNKLPFLKQDFWIRNTPYTLNRALSSEHSHKQSSDKLNELSTTKTTPQSAPSCSYTPKAGVNEPSHWFPDVTIVMKVKGQQTHTIIPNLALLLLIWRRSAANVPHAILANQSEERKTELRCPSGLETLSQTSNVGEIFALCKRDKLSFLVQSLRLCWTEVCTTVVPSGGHRMRCPWNSEMTKAKALETITALMIWNPDHPGYYRTAKWIDSDPVFSSLPKNEANHREIDGICQHCRIYMR